MYLFALLLFSLNVLCFGAPHLLALLGIKDAIKSRILGETYGSKCLDCVPVDITYPPLYNPQPSGQSEVFSAPTNHHEDRYSGVAHGFSAGGYGFDSRQFVGPYVSGDRHDGITFSGLAPYIHPNDHIDNISHSTNIDNTPPPGKIGAGVLNGASVGFINVNPEINAGVGGIIFANGPQQPETHFDYNQHSSVTLADTINTGTAYGSTNSFANEQTASRNVYGGRNNFEHMLKGNGFSFGVGMGAATSSTSSSSASTTL